MSQLHPHSRHVLLLLMISNTSMACAVALHKYVDSMSTDSLSWADEKVCSV